MHRLTRLTLLLALTGALAACGGDEALRREIERGSPLFEPVDGGIFTINIVADLGVSSLHDGEDRKGARNDEGDK